MSERARSETELIQTFLAPLASEAAGAFGLNDDAALIEGEAGIDLAISTDPIIAGVHFFKDDRPDDIAWKALAVNVSDIVAKGSQPAAYLMTLSFPEPPQNEWMAAFARGLQDAQETFGCRLIGGDTDIAPGPLSIGITAIGTLPAGAFVHRQGARAGDHVLVSGTIGDAALGLAIRSDPRRFEATLGEGEKQALLARYLRPQPQIALSEALRRHASAALDISDGFLKDLARLAGTSGIDLELAALPVSLPARALLAADPTLADTILGGGDDYELLVAVPAGEVSAFARAAARVGVAVSDLGVLNADSPIRVFGDGGRPIEPSTRGYDHFSR